MLLVQFLVLAFTGALWWIARRDLASRAAASAARVRQRRRNWNSLLATLEALVTDLAHRLERVERREEPNLAAGVKPSEPNPAAMSGDPSSRPKELGDGGKGALLAAPSFPSCSRLP